MKKNLLFIGAAFVAMSANAQTLQQVPVTGGYTADVFAEAYPFNNFLVNGVDDGGSGYLVENAPVSNVYGLPKQSEMPVTSATGVVYNLQYDANNALVLKSGVDGYDTYGTLTFTTPVTTPQLYLQTISGNGDSEMSVVVNYSDATKTEYLTSASTGFTIKDWWNTSTDPAMHPGEGFYWLQRVAFDGTIPQSDRAVRLFDTMITTDDTKAISSVEISLDNGSATGPFLSVLGVSTGTTPVAISDGYNADVIAEGYPISDYTSQAPLDDNKFVLFSNDVTYPSPTADNTANVYLPASGKITSAFTGIEYTFDYKNLNSTRLVADDSETPDVDERTATLTLGGKPKASNLYVLYIAGNGGFPVDVTYNYADGTTSGAIDDEFTALDWYNTGDPVVDTNGMYGEALSHLYRANGNVDNRANFRIMEQKIIVSDATNPLESVTFNNVNGKGKCCIVGIAMDGVFTDATGIQGVASDKVVNDGKIFNLAGQQVSKSYKGIVIKNGKKMIQK
jgi:hypothetical protein